MIYNNKYNHIDNNWFNWASEGIEKEELYQ